MENEQKELIESEPKEKYSLKYIKSVEEQNTIIEKYLNEVKTCKKILCQQWFRGFCSFSPKQCKYAHGLSDLHYEKASQRSNDGEHINQDEIFYIKYDSRNYQILKDYIEKLRSLNTLKEDEDFTLEDLNAHGKFRTKIRNRFFNEFTLEVMSFLFAQYPNVYLSKNFFIREFALIKFPNKFDWVFNSDYYYINDVPLPPRTINSFKLVLPFESPEMIEKKFKTLLVDIVSELQQNSSAEITEKQLSGEFYKKKVFDLPPLHIILKKLNKGVADFVKEIQNSNEEEKKTNFVSLKEQKEKFIQNMEICLNDFWEQESRQRFGFGKFSDLLNLLRKNNFLNSAKDIYPSEVQLLDFLKIFLVKKQILLIFLFSETFLINLNLLRKKTEIEFLQNLPMKKIKSTNCGKHNEEFKEENFLFLQIKEHEKNNEKWVLFNESRIVVVNDIESFYYAKEVLSSCTKIGVDIEGHLCEGGWIDLIQMGINFNESRKIFIFDIYFLKLSNQQIYSETKLFLKGILQNNKILKVFHDCRKDSLALHLFLDQTCSTKVYDTACLHLLIETLKIYKSTIDEIDEKKLTEMFHKIENLPWPGLNVILSVYQATHGVNPLKEKMKKKFNNEPRSYFVKRPIDEEFLEYSAKDVEDLVEACENLEKVLEELLLEFNVGIKEILVKEYLMEKISYYYVKAGCLPPLNDSFG